MYCVYCGSEVSRDNKFCQQCGNPIQKTIEKENRITHKCILCGATISENEEVCERCKRDYEVPKNTEETNVIIDDRENKDGIVALVFAVFVPFIGFILGLIFIVKNNDKSKPFLAIAISLFSFAINWFLWYQKLLNIFG